VLRREVEDEARVVLEPAVDLGGGVVGRVVEDAMHRALPVVPGAAFEQLDKLDARLLLLDVAEHTAGAYVERREQVEHAVPDVLELTVHDRMAEPHRQVLVLAADRLNAGLLVEGEDRRSGRWLQVQGDDVGELLVVVGIPAREEVSLAMWLELRRGELPADRRRSRRRRRGAGRTRRADPRQTSA
jgi:hypothetical protein